MSSESDTSAIPAPTDRATPPDTTDRQRVVLVTGVLGAGKTTALRALEDLGWETIDNFPIRLLEGMIDNPERATDTQTPMAIGFDSRTRGFNPHDAIELIKRLTRREDISLTTLFLDCSGEELVRRYNETRRRHPLAADMPLGSGIAAEREVMEPMRRWADIVINTTAFSTHLLTQAIREQFEPETGRLMTITVSSFGFARGMPPVADYIFDMRFLNNPHWDRVLRPMTGLDQPIAEYIRKDPAYDDAFAGIRDLLLTVLPRFRAQGKAYVNIAFGCTGGRHRSVFMAEQVSAALRANGFSLTIFHRNLGSRAADLVEGGATR